MEPLSKNGVVASLDGAEQRQKHEKETRIRRIIAGREVVAIDGNNREQLVPRLGEIVRWKQWRAASATVRRDREVETMESS
ncbi:hypothetical protein J6590_046876 [Homalodisca vitripennis]|nr:hypothetical protein J6590_046876 [Homalodisca vitripennis]